MDKMDKMDKNNQNINIPKQFYVVDGIRLRKEVTTSFQINPTLDEIQLESKNNYMTLIYDRESNLCQPKNYSLRCFFDYKEASRYAYASNSNLYNFEEHINYDEKWHKFIDDYPHLFL